MALLHRETNGFSLAELAAVLVLMGLMATLAIRTLLTVSPTKQYVQKASDFIEHLAQLYQQIRNENGVPPLRTIAMGDVAANTDGLPGLIEDYETGVSSGSRAIGSKNIYNQATASNAFLDYPGNMRVYLRPDDLGITGISNPILSNTNDREWLLVDFNTSTSPTNLSTNGDLLLIRVNNSSGRVQTAYQVCGSTFSASFYDTDKGLTSGVCP